MANCCSYEGCDELVTIGYLKGMASSFSKCSKSVKTDGIVVSASCCSDDTNVDLYVPTYSQLTGSTMLPKSNISTSNPESDIPGFNVSEVSYTDSSCCASGGDYGVPRRYVSFDKTEAYDVTIDIIQTPNDCDLDASYSWRTTKTWRRHSYHCDNNGDYTDDYSDVTPTPTTATSYFSRSISEVGDYEWSAPSVSTTITESISDACGGHKSVTIPISVGGISFGFTVEKPLSNIVPCEGGVNATVISNVHDNCNKLSITLEGDNLITGKDYIIGNSIHIGENTEGKVSGGVNIKYSAYNGTISGVANWSFTREPCEWSVRYEGDGCSAFGLIEQRWDSTSNVTQHDYYPTT